MTGADLANRRCKPCEGGTPLDAAAARNLLGGLEGWQLDEKAAQIHRRFDFKNFHETMAFVNAVAWVAHQEDHHPDLAVGYNRCTVRYSTHAVKGLSENDFICAAKIDALLRRSSP
jgi:4a-hydroxytetrahydrobiopterin dehydratase